MQDVLRQVGMSRSGLEKAFREYYVRAPMEELRKVRIEKAKKMLRETDEAVSSIAVFFWQDFRRWRLLNQSDFSMLKCK